VRVCASNSVAVAAETDPITASETVEEPPQEVTAIEPLTSPTVEDWVEMQGSLAEQTQMLEEIQIGVDTVNENLTEIQAILNEK